MDKHVPKNKKYYVVKQKFYLGFVSANWKFMINKLKI